MNTPPRTRPNANRNGSLDDELKLIRRKLNALKIPWAISGSMATKLHANSLGVPLHRLPNDIDIVIRPKDVGTVIMTLAEIGYTSNSPPPIRFHHIKLHHGRFSLDLLSAGGNLAPNIRANNIVVINKTPIVKIRHLMTQKNRIIANHFVSNINKSSAIGNKNFLEKLSKHV
jgi:hypothetical protein